jgi:NitT/TauT family transport system substrate-binding protein
MIVKKLLLALIGVVALAVPAQAQDKPLKKVSLALGSQINNIAYPWLNMAVAMGYWKEEGYDVNVFIGQSSLQSVQLLVAGTTDFAEVNSAPLMQSRINNNIPIRGVMMNTVVDWSLVVPEDSPIKSVQEFKGKAIGVSSLGTGGIAMVQSYLRANGLNPDTDITILPVGVGPSTVEALRQGRVQGLMYWAAALASFENAGAKFRYFVAPEWRKYPDFSITTLQSTIERDPKMVEAIVRGAAKASLFSVTNPECVRRLQWARWPDTKPSGADEATLIKRDLHHLNAQLDGLKQAYALGGSKLWGNVTGADFVPLEKFLFDTKIINAKLPNPADYFITTPGFFERANTFDHAAVEAQAKACKL